MRRVRLGSLLKMLLLSSLAACEQAAVTSEERRAEDVEIPSYDLRLDGTMSSATWDTEKWKNDLCVSGKYLDFWGLKESIQRRDYDGKKVPVMVTRANGLILEGPYVTEWALAGSAKAKSAELIVTSDDSGCKDDADLLRFDFNGKSRCAIVNEHPFMPFPQPPYHDQTPRTRLMPCKEVAWDIAYHMATAYWLLDTLYDKAIFDKPWNKGQACSFGYFKGLGAHDETCQRIFKGLDPGYHLQAHMADVTPLFIDYSKSSPLVGERPKYIEKIKPPGTRGEQNKFIGNYRHMEVPMCRRNTTDKKCYLLAAALEFPVADYAEVKGPPVNTPQPMRIEGSEKATCEMTFALGVPWTTIKDQSEAYRLKLDSAADFTDKPAVDLKVHVGGNPTTKERSMYHLPFIQDPDTALFSDETISAGTALACLGGIGLSMFGGPIGIKIAGAAVGAAGCLQVANDLFAEVQVFKPLDTVARLLKLDRPKSVTPNKLPARLYCKPSQQTYGLVRAFIKREVDKPIRDADPKSQGIKRVKLVGAKGWTGIRDVEIVPRQYLDVKAHVRSVVSDAKRRPLPLAVKTEGDPLLNNAMIVKADHPAAEREALYLRGERVPCMHQHMDALSAFEMNLGVKDVEFEGRTLKEYQKEALSLIRKVMESPNSAENQVTRASFAYPLWNGRTWSVWLPFFGPMVKHMAGGEEAGKTLAKNPRRFAPTQMFHEKTGVLEAGDVGAVGRNDMTPAIQNKRVPLFVELEVVPPLPAEDIKKYTKVAVPQKQGPPKEGVVGFGHESTGMCSLPWAAPDSAPRVLLELEKNPDKFEERKDLKLPAPLLAMAPNQCMTEVTVVAIPRDIAPPSDPTCGLDGQRVVVWAQGPPEAVRYHAYMEVRHGSEVKGYLAKNAAYLFEDGVPAVVMGKEIVIAAGDVVNVAIAHVGSGDRIVKLQYSYSLLAQWDYSAGGLVFGYAADDGRPAPSEIPLAMPAYQCPEPDPAVDFPTLSLSDGQVCDFTRPGCEPVGSCGNGSPDGDETCASCPSDVGLCAAACGDGQVEAGETCDTCPQDRIDACFGSTSGDGVCTAAEAAARAADCGF